MVSIVTLNVRLQTLLDGANQFVRRKDEIVRCLLREMPDVIGFQEMTLPMLDVFRRAMPAYGFIGQSSRRNNRGEYTAIAYRKDTIYLETSATFWLSKTPDREGSRFLLQSLDPRTCTCALFAHLPTGARFRYFNTHLDHLSSYARLKGLFVIFERMAAYQSIERLPLFWGGDLNFTPRNALYPLCLSGTEEGLGLMDLTGEIVTTFQWFGALKRPLKLDYLFADSETAKDFTKVRMIQRGEDGRYLSDHNAIRLDWAPGARVRTLPGRKRSAPWVEPGIPVIT